MRRRCAGASKGSPRSMSARRESPSTHDMTSTIGAAPSVSGAEAAMKVGMAGWWRPRSMLTSRSKRSKAFQSLRVTVSITLTATGWWLASSSARQVAPLAPWPARSTRRKR